MQIKNKWVVYDSKDNTYYSCLKDNSPVMGPLNSLVHTYKREFDANRAIDRIWEACSERIECKCLRPLYIESEEVPDVPKDEPVCDLYNGLHKLCDKYNISFDGESKGFGAELADLARRFRKIIPDVPADKPANPPKMTVAGDESEWETVFVCAVPPREPEGKVTFSKIALCRRQVGDREIFGVRASDGKLYSAGFGGGETALRCFLEEYYNYLLPRVTRESR